MYDAEDLTLAYAALDIARESGDTDEVDAALDWIREVAAHVDRTPEYDHDETSAYDLIL